MLPSERLKKVIEYLNMDIEPFSKSIGRKRSQGIRDVLSGKAKTIDDKFANQIILAHPNISKVFLMTGEGDVSNLENDAEKEAQSNKEEDNSYLTHRRDKKNGDDEDLIPIFDRTLAMQGRITGSLIPTTETDKTGLVRKDMFKNAQFVIRSSGNSMIPTYPSDAWIGIRRINERILNPGSVYVIDVGSDLILKRIYYKDDDQYSGFLVCLSDNTMLEEGGARKGKLKYPPFEVSLTDVLGVYKVTDYYRPNEIEVLK
ncbi:S24 family peptidase [Arachidicoccus sp.]|uniref:S24 family peptidase n=1 Tax=Arachidicoccus sp. TaxID=1872624 RepID=UPI003D226460